MNDKVPVKILMLIEHLDCGGAERQFCYLAVALHQRGYDVQVVVYRNRLYFMPYLQTNGISCDFEPKLENKCSRAFRLAKIIRENHITHVIAYLPSANKSACAARLLRRFQLIVSERTVNKTLSLGNRMAYRMYGIADYVVTNSQMQHRLMVRYYPTLKGKLRTITNIVDTNRFCPPAAYAENSKIYVVTLARLGQEKNPLRYIEAIHLLCQRGIQDVEYHWWGSLSADRQLTQQMKQRIHDLQLTDIFFLHDRCDDAVSLYHKADAFCLPSVREGFPNSLCEAMSCGLPVACADISDIPLIVEEGKNGYLFNPKEVTSIAGALEKLVRLSKQERQQMGKRNRERMIEMGNKDALVSQYIDLLEA